jgi:YcxB-like protein
LAWALTLDARLLAGIIIGVVIVCILLFTVLPIIMPALYRRSFRRNFTQRPYRFSWSDQGFVIESDDGEARLNWSAVKKWKESDRLFLIYISDFIFYILPKRAFPDDGAIVSLREKLGAPAVH